MANKVDLAGLQEYDKGVKDALSKKADQTTVDALSEELDNLSVVEANPSSMTEDAEPLTGLKVKEDYYQIPSTEFTFSDTDSDDTPGQLLKRIDIGEDTWKLPTAQFILRDTVSEGTTQELKELEIKGDRWKIGGSGGGIIDVEVLPVIKNTCYLYNTTYGVNNFNGTAITVITVETLPETGEDFNMTVICYHILSENEVYAYDSDNSLWMTAEQVCVALGVYGGTITDESTATDATLYYIVKKAAEEHDLKSFYRTPDGKTYYISNGRFVLIGTNIIYLPFTESESGTLTDEQMEIIQNNDDVSIVFGLPDGSVKYVLKKNLDAVITEDIAIIQFSMVIDFMDLSVCTVSVNCADKTYEFNGKTIYTDFRLSIQNGMLSFEKVYDGGNIECSEVYIDEEPTDDSENLITSGGVKKYVDKAITNIEIPESLASTEYVDNAISNIDIDSKIAAYMAANYENGDDGSY